MTYLCAAIFVGSNDQALRSAALAAEAGADLIEYRIDRHSTSFFIFELVQRSPIPCIVTCRAKNEGGYSELTDAARGVLLDAAAHAGTSYIDVELQASGQI